MKLNDEEMKKVYGGAIPWEAVAAGVGIIAFLIGLISGITNPSKCNA